MNNPATKNGNSGIRKRTKEPKFATVSPTENAKNNENIIENNNNGFLPTRLKKLKKLPGQWDHLSSWSSRSPMSRGSS